MTVSVVIQCREFKPEDCAGFQICASAGPDLPKLCCEGVVYRPKGGHAAVSLGRGLKEVTTAPVGATTTVQLEVSNPNDRAIETTVVVTDRINVLGFPPANGTR